MRIEPHLVVRETGAYLAAFRRAARLGLGDVLSAAGRLASQRTMCRSSHGARPAATAAAVRGGAELLHRQNQNYRVANVADNDNRAFIGRRF